MKLLVVVAVSSLVLNGALIAAFVAKPHLAPAALQNFVPGASADKAGPKSDPAQVAVAPKKKPASKGLSWASFQTEDILALVARLKAAGFPPSVIRAIVDAELQQRFAPRLQELRRVLDETPYWRSDPMQHMFGGSKFYETYSQISRERMKVLREILGKDAYAYGGGTDPTEQQRRQFGDLSPGKIELVQRINDDYSEMISQVRAAMQGITLPEDRDKLALLEREKRADLAAILTPEELADYEMRTSTLTGRMRTTLSIMDATEAEFRAIFTAHQAHADILYPSVPGIIYRPSDSSDPRNVATQKIHADLTKALGADRFAQFQRANDRDFQQLYQLTRPENVPYDTVVRAHDARTSASAASVKIVEDPAMSADEKRNALKELAQQSRTQILSTLGQKAGPTYVESAQWLIQLERGSGFTITPTGSLSFRGIPPPPGPVAPKK